MRLGALVLLVLVPALARAEDRLQVEIHRGAREELRFAVQRFRPDAVVGVEAPESFYRHLTAALEYSGLIRVVDPAAFLEPIETQDDRRPMIPCDNWRGIGADALVEGSIERVGQQIRVRFRLWDVPRCRMEGGAGVFEADVGGIGLLGRQVADELVRRFTGRRGVASTQIAFISDRSGSREVYLMEADGSDKKEVTSNGSINLFPSWSPRGDALLYTSYRGGNPDLFLLSRGARNSGRLLKHAAPKYRGVFSPADDRIAVVIAENGNTDIYTVNRRGRKLRRITRSRAIEVSPAWSPDGKRLAFVSDRSGSPQIYILDFDSGETRRITYRGSYNASPSWSPTGEWIVFAAQTGTNFDLYLISPETGYTTPLVVHPRSDEDPAWSPDGRKVAFVSSRRGAKEVYVVDLNGSNLRRLTPSFGDCTSPAWSPWLD